MSYLLSLERLLRLDLLLRLLLTRLPEEEEEEEDEDERRRCFLFLLLRLSSSLSEERRPMLLIGQLEKKKTQTEAGLRCGDSTEQPLHTIDSATFLLLVILFIKCRIRIESLLVKHVNKKAVMTL